MNYTIYNPSTGQIEMVFTSQDSDLTQQNLNGRSWIPGNYSSLDYYILNNQPVQKPARPEVPGLVYDFDYQSLTWQINLSRSQQASRQLRNSQLESVDRINPVWYNSLSADQQSELIAYRQALLAVPQQAGFPTQVEWPAKPAWL